MFEKSKVLHYELNLPKFMSPKNNKEPNNFDKQSLSIDIWNTLYLE